MLVKVIIIIVKGRGHLFFSLAYSNIYGLTGKEEKGSDGVLESQICQNRVWLKEERDEEWDSLEN